MHTEEANLLGKLRLMIEKTDTDYLLGKIETEEYNKIREQAAKIITDLENKLDSIKKRKWWKH